MKRKRAREEKEEGDEGAHGPVVLVTDVPTTSVSIESVQGIFPVRPRSSQDEGAIVHGDVVGQRRLGGGPPLQKKSILPTYANPPNLATERSETIFFLSLSTSKTLTRKEQYLIRT